MNLNNQDLKVDQTLLQYEETGIFITNINIPADELTNLDNVLDRVGLLIANDYSTVQNIQFQVCSSYELRNTENGDLRQWTGSFNPRGNQFNELSPFQTFTPNFKTVVKRACLPDNIYNKLRFYHVKTNWVFHQLKSVIISVQARVNINHPTILRRGLLGRRNGRRRRTISTFYLP